jgi:hypothetical protein
VAFDRQDGVLEAARGEIGGVNPVLQHAGSPKLQPSASSGLKQSISPRKERMDCFVARAPRNDGGYSFAFSRRYASELWG